MKTLATFLSLIFLNSFNLNQTAQVSDLTNPDSVIIINKTDLFEYLDETKEALDESVEGLSDEQMQYKADPESWSVAQIMEHIIIVEGVLKSLLEGKLSEDETPELRSEIKMTDDQILGFITDRSQKVKTQDQFQPAGKYISADEALEVFDDQREDMVDWLKDTDADLRNYVNEFPFGKIDAYQTVLFMAGHTERHTKQIEEVKDSPEFPES